MTDSIHLLLIDDDELDRLSVVRALKRAPMSFEISECATAAQGLQKAAEQHFDAILLDYRLPDQNGISVLRELRSGRFAGAAVIMISRFEDEGVADQCLEAGAQDFLLKDEVDARRLLRAVRHARQRYSMEMALKNSHEQLRILSERDPLTGLANRRGYELALNLCIAQSRRTAKGMAVLLLDLDDFKSVNDTLGHDVGDLLLVEVASRLSEKMRDGDCLCRLGGDEFVVLTGNLEHDEQAALLAERVVSAFQPPIILKSLELRITASIGVAVLENATMDTAELLKNADVAMYRAKQDGRNQYRFYSKKLHEAVQHIADVKRDLQKALDCNEFHIHYQPQISVSDDTLHGIEALVRWRHPRLGLLMPDSFISIAEESKLIIPIGNWVLQNAFKQFAQWKADYPKQCSNLTLAVNLSAVQLHDANLLSNVTSAMCDHQIDPESLELEMTENALITDPSGFVQLLSALAETGIALSLDDFGTGYSSLQHLQLFPIKVLKIDKSFVSTIGRGEKLEQLLVALMRFARGLNLKLVAEGVETPEHADFCKRNGCDVLQGHFYSKAISAEEFETFFLSSNESGFAVFGTRTDI